MNCIVCNKSLDVGITVNHHISYFPENKIKVHKKCHFIIHNTDNFPELKPTKESTRKFYNGNEHLKNSIRPFISNELFDEVKILSNNVLGSFEDSLKIIIDELKDHDKPLEKSVKQ